MKRFIVVVLLWATLDVESFLQPPRTTNGFSESTAIGSTESSDTVGGLLLSWLQEEFGQDGTYSNRVEIGLNRDGVRGLLVTEPVDENEIVLSIPVQACLQNHMAPDWAHSLPKKVQLTVLVLHVAAEVERGDQTSSFWKPYLDSWPSEIPSVLDLIEEDELIKEAQCTTLIRDIQSHQDYVREEYSKIIELSPQGWGEQFSLQAFQETLALVGSRSIGVSKSDSILVPMVDMANHAFDPSATYRLDAAEEKDDANSGRVLLVATRPLNAGDEVTISYGSHCNRIFAGNYGFVPQGNPFDFELVSLVEIILGAQEEGSVLDESIDIFALEQSVAQLGLPTTNLRLNASSGPEELLLLVLRIALGDDELKDEVADLLEAMEEDEIDEEDLYMWDQEASEMKKAERDQVLSSSCRVLERRLGGHTTLEEDQAMLDQERNSISPSKRLLIELRLARKSLFRSIASSGEFCKGYPTSDTA